MKKTEETMLKPLRVLITWNAGRIVIAVEVVILVLNLGEVGRCGRSACEALTVTHELDVLETRRDALVARRREAVEIDGHIAVVAAAALHRIQDRLHMAVNDLRSVLRCRIEEEMPCVVLVIGAVDVAVAKARLPATPSRPKILRFINWSPE